MSADINGVKNFLIASIAVAQSTKEGGPHATVASLLAAYRRLFGKPMPLDQLGYRTLESLITEALSDTLELYKVGPDSCVRSLVRPAGQHIVEMMRKEKGKKHKKSKKKGRFSAPSAPRRSNAAATAAPLMPAIGTKAAAAIGRIRQQQKESSFPLLDIPDEIREGASKVAISKPGYTVCHFDAKYELRFGHKLPFVKLGFPTLISMMRRLESLGNVRLFHTPKETLVLGPVLKPSAPPPSSKENQRTSLPATASEQLLSSRRNSSPSPRPVHPPPSSSTASGNNIAEKAEITTVSKGTNRFLQGAEVEQPLAVRKAVEPPQLVEKPLELAQSVAKAVNPSFPSSFKPPGLFAPGTKGENWFPTVAKHQDHTDPSVTKATEPGASIGQVTERMANVSLRTPKHRESICSSATIGSSYRTGGVGAIPRSPAHRQSLDGRTERWRELPLRLPPVTMVTNEEAVIPEECVSPEHRLPLVLRRFATAGGHVSVSVVRVNSPDELIVGVRSSDLLAGGLETVIAHLQVKMSEYPSVAWKQMALIHVTAGALCAVALDGGQYHRARVTLLDPLVRVSLIDMDGIEVTVGVKQIFYLPREFADSALGALHVKMAIVGVQSASSAGGWDESAAGFLRKRLLQYPSGTTVRLPPSVLVEPPFGCCILVQFVYPSLADHLISEGFAVSPVPR